MKTHLVGFFSHPVRAVLASAAAAALLFAAVAGTLPPRTNVSFAFTISQQARQETSDYSYDGYYALRASELVADTMISWLSTPSVVKEVFADAGIQRTDSEIRAISGRVFRGKKYSSQNVVVAYAASDAETAAKLYASLSRHVSERARTLVLSPEQETLFIVSASEPVIAETRIPPARAALAGAFVGAFIGLACAYASWRPKRLAA
ncbi:MAG: hypothetical protein QY323_05075 [Patescibacteria group bacterium]|nr:MAG: hypothetical protein QY323_05075 [Patescibacteria group bacterium]